MDFHVPAPGGVAPGNPLALAAPAAPRRGGAQRKVASKVKSAVARRVFRYGSLCEYMAHDTVVEKHIRVLCGPQWAKAVPELAAASTRSLGGMRTGPEDPQRQSARTRADKLELPPPNDGVEEKY